MPSDEPTVVPPRTRLARPSWRDPVLVGAVLVVALLTGYQLAVTVLRPPWLGPSSAWLLALFAWLKLLGVTLFSWWASRVHLPTVLSWWLISAALFFHALARTHWLIGEQVFLARHVPFPWWSDLFFLLQFPCWFLAFLLLPSPPDQSRPRGLARLRMFFDSLLVMSAATLLTWYFLLALIPLQQEQSLLGNITHLAYPIANLGLLFILTRLFFHLSYPQVGRAIIGLLIVAFTCLIIGYSWYAALTLGGHYQPGDPPDLFLFLGCLCFPLAVLVRFRLTRQEPLRPTARPVVQAGLGLQRQDVLEAIRFLLPFLGALLTSVLILVLAPLDSQAGRNPILADGLSVGLLGLVLVRQGVVFLEHTKVRHEQEAIRANELALQAANQQLETFLGIVSHELKTPLTSILMGMQLIRRRVQHLLRSLAEATGDAVPQVEAVQALAETLLQQGGRLNRLVNELLDISRIQAGRLELQIKPADLSALVRTVVEEHRLANPERTILLHLPSSGSVPVRADAERIGQVVTNYLTNALKYSDEEHPVEVSVQEEGQQGGVWIRDQGPGIPLGEQERLWERFHRVPGIEIQSGSGIGLGLGLYISKTIIAQHGGQVGVQSMPGQGSTFWFTLPLAVVGLGQES